MQGNIDSQVDAKRVLDVLQGISSRLSYCCVSVNSRSLEQTRANCRYYRKNTDTVFVLSVKLAIGCQEGVLCLWKYTTNSKVLLKIWKMQILFGGLRFAVSAQNCSSRNEVWTLWRSVCCAVKIDTKICQREQKMCLNDAPAKIIKTKMCFNSAWTKGTHRHGAGYFSLGFVPGQQVQVTISDNGQGPTIGRHGSRVWQLGPAPTPTRRHSTTPTRGHTTFWWLGEDGGDTAAQQTEI